MKCRGSFTLYRHSFLSFKVPHSLWPKNILSSSFPFIHFSYFYATYWSRKKKKLSFLTIGRWPYTSLPTSTSSASYALEAWPVLCPLRTHLRRPRSINSSLLLCPNPWRTDSGHLHVLLADAWSQVGKRRSCTRNWHGSIPRSSLSCWFHTVSLSTEL